MNYFNYQLQYLTYLTNLGLNIGFIPISVNFPLTAVEHKSQCKRKNEAVKLFVAYRVYHFGSNKLLIWFSCLWNCTSWKYALFTYHWHKIFWWLRVSFWFRLTLSHCFPFAFCFPPINAFMKITIHTTTINNKVDMQYS